MKDIYILIVFFQIIILAGVGLDIHFSATTPKNGAQIDPTSNVDYNTPYLKYFEVVTKRVNGVDCDFDIWVIDYLDGDCRFLKQIKLCDSYRQIAPQNVPYPDSINSMIRRLKKQSPRNDVFPPQKPDNKPHISI